MNNTESNALTPVEKTMFDKYGDIGLRIYALMDGETTPEKMMDATGLTEAQLVDMLVFMMNEEIIK